MHRHTQDTQRYTQTYTLHGQLGLQRAWQLKWSLSPPVTAQGLAGIQRLLGLLPCNRQTPKVLLLGNVSVNPSGRIVSLWSPAMLGFWEA